MNTIRIYVASLSDYNAGRLHGRWIDATLGAEAIRAEIEAMLQKSPECDAEEYAIHDFEGFGTYPVSEYESIDKVAAMAEAIENHGHLIVELMAHLGLDDPEEAIKYHEENYQGCFGSLEEWSENFLADSGMLDEIPENLRPYFDFEKYANDARIGGDIFEIEMGGDVHVYFLG